jgi:hypothetical protein
MSTTLADIEGAHAAAQRAFGDMVRARSYADRHHPATIAYVQAERLVDDLLASAQWERARDALDAVTRHDPECDCHYINRQAALALGDHHVGVGR